MKKLCSIIVILVVLVVNVTICYASVTTNRTSNSAGESITQSTADEEGIHVFTDGDVFASDVSVSIAQTLVDIETMSTMKNSEITENIIFIIDLSTSVKQQAQNDIKEIITNVANSLHSTQKVMIIGFGEETEVICESTNDSKYITYALESLNYNRQASMIYDALNDTLNILDEYPKNELNNIILVTDGVLYTDKGITANELYLYVQKCGYEVNTIGLDQTYNVDDLKELYALSRLTGGEAYSTKDNNNTAIAKEIVYQNMRVDYYKIPLSQEFADGSEKTITIKSNNGSLISDIRIPRVILEAFEEMVFEEEVIEEEPIPEPIIPEVEEVIAQPVVEEKAGINLLYLGIIALVLILIIVAIVLLNKNKKSNIDQDNSMMFNPMEEFKDDLNKTQLINNSGLTEFLQPNSGPLKATLHQKNNSQVKRSILGDTLIGRNNNCDFCTSNEPSVSGEHCKITFSNNSFYIENLSNSNGTIVNGKNIAMKTKLDNDDVIKLGRLEFIFKLES